MDAEQLLEAAQAYYEAYWLSLDGILAGVRLPCWNDLSEEQIDAIVVGIEAVEAYIAAIPEE